MQSDGDNAGLLQKDQREMDQYIMEGTWIRDRSIGDLHTIGVIEGIYEKESLLSSRIGIYWRAGCYENTSVLLFLEKLKSGELEVDDGR